MDDAVAPLGLDDAVVPLGLNDADYDSMDSMMNHHYSDPSEDPSPSVKSVRSETSTVNAGVRPRMRRLSRNRSVILEDEEKKQKESSQKSLYVDAAAMKAKVHQTLTRKKYNVCDFYKETGCPQRIARSPIFDKATLSVIAFNALWIAIDTDWNKAELLFDAHPIFIVCENFFCIYFGFEWLVRFCSFRRKFDGLKDGWFVFDTFMVAMMVLETWIFGILTYMMKPGAGSGAGAGNVSIMRLARLLRLSRMARMGKLLRLMPELMIMLKGMIAATRSVFFTLLLLIIILYIFGIGFVQLSKGNDVISHYFDTVPISMQNLLVYGIFLDNVGRLMEDLASHEPILLFLFFIFVLLGAFTVMNMLIGVLCEVVSAVASTESEEMLVSHVNEKISTVMELLDSDGGGSISKREFLHIIENAEAVRCLSDVGVDVFALIDNADYIFNDDDVENTEEMELDFKTFMEVVLALRGTNQATVKDVVDLRKFMRMSMQQNLKQTQQVLDFIRQGTQETQKMVSSVTERHVPSSRDVDRNHSTEVAAFGSRSDSMKFMNHSSYAQPTLQSEFIRHDAGLVKDSKKRLRWSQQPEHSALPTLPPPTPNGQLLSQVPIDLINPAAINADSSEHVGLTGDWEPVGSLEAQPNLKKSNSPGEAKWNGLVETGFPLTHGPGLFTHRHIPMNGHVQPARDSTTEQRIARLHAQGCDRATASLVDSELQAIQSQLEWVCGQLAIGLNEAIDMAGRSVERAYARKFVDLNQGASEGANASNGRAGQTIVL